MCPNISLITVNISRLSSLVKIGSHTDLKNKKLSSSLETHKCKDLKHL